MDVYGGGQGSGGPQKVSGDPEGSLGTSGESGIWRGLRKVLGIPKGVWKVFGESLGGHRGILGGGPGPHLEELDADAGEHELQQGGDNHDVADGADGHKHALYYVLGTGGVGVLAVRQGNSYSPTLGPPLVPPPRTLLGPSNQARPPHPPWDHSKALSAPQPLLRHPKPVQPLLKSSVESPGTLQPTQAPQRPSWNPPEAPQPCPETTSTSQSSPPQRPLGCSSQFRPPPRPTNHPRIPCPPRNLRPSSQPGAP